VINKEKETCGYVRVGDTCSSCNQPWAECECSKNATITVSSTFISANTSAVQSNQDWFWLRKWQSAECQVDTDLANGHFETYDTMDEFLDSLSE